MGTVVVSARRRTTVPRAELFDRIGTPAAGGWLFDCSCDSLAPGSAVTLTLPLGGGDQGTVQVVGRIARVRAPDLVEIQHDQPWRGRLVLRLTTQGSETVVSLHEELDADGLQWLMLRRGHVLAHRRSASTPLGLLTSKSGSGSLFGAAVDAMATLAQEEVNADRGAGVPPVELLVGDDATDASTGVAEARRLVAMGARTVLVATASHTYRAVARALSGTGVLVVYAIMNEGGAAGRLQVQLGERPADQLRLAGPVMMQLADGRRWFLAGNDYSWPASVHRTARRLLPRQGGIIAGEARVPLGSTDFEPVLSRLAGSGADLLLSTFVGNDAAEFQRQLHAAGLDHRLLTLAPAMDEATLARIGPTAARRVHGVAGYFGSLDSAANRDLTRRYRDRFGPWAAPLSTLSEAVYEAVLLWWDAVRRVGAEDTLALADALREGRHELPRGVVVLSTSGAPTQRLRLAVADGIDFRVLPGHL